MWAPVTGTCTSTYLLVKFYRVYSTGPYYPVLHYTGSCTYVFDPPAGMPYQFHLWPASIRYSRRPVGPNDRVPPVLLFYPIPSYVEISNLHVINCPLPIHQCPSPSNLDHPGSTCIKSFILVYFVSAGELTGTGKLKDP